jgi:hypothetical protein
MKHDTIIFLIWDFEDGAAGLLADVVAYCPTVGIYHISKLMRAERDAEGLCVEEREPGASWVNVMIPFGKGAGLAAPPPKRDICARH